MALWMISGIFGFATGGAFIWFFKTKVQSIVIDANTLSAKLHAQADKIKAGM